MTISKTADRLADEAAAHIDRGEISEAQEALRAHLALRPGNANAWHALGVLAQSQGDLQAATDFLAQAVAINPAQAVYHNDLGLVRFEQGDLDAAVVSLQRAKEIDPQFSCIQENLEQVRAWQFFKLALRHKATGDFDAAVGLAASALARLPDQPEAHSLVGALHYELGEFDDAIRCHQAAVRLAPDYADGYQMLGQALQESQEPGLAAVAFQQAVALAPAVAQAAAGRVTQRPFTSLEDLRARCGMAFRPLEAELRKSFGMSHPTPPMVADKCRAYRLHNQLDQAIRLYQSYLKLEPRWSKGWYLLGASLQAQGKVAEALECFSQAQMLTPYFVACNSRVKDIDIFCDAAALCVPETDELLQQAQDCFSRGDTDLGLLHLLVARLKATDSKADSLWESKLAELGKQRVHVVFLFHSALGHLVWNTELFLRNRQLACYDADVHHLVLAGSNPANRQLLNMYKRAISVIESDRWYYLLHEVLPDEYCQKIRISNADSRLYLDTHASVSFTADEEAQGRSELRRMGIDPDKDWFVCAFARDDGYYGETDVSFRNADIDDYCLAIEEVVQRGGYVIRLGSKVKKPLGIQHARVIDYATLCRSDFMDIYLVAKSHFVFGTYSGIVDVAASVDVPFLGVNGAPLGLCPFRPGDVYIPKKLINIKSGEPMTMRQAASVDIHDLWSGTAVRSMGYQYVDNSPEEIRDAVVEMLDRLAGTFQEDDDYADLLRRYFKAREQRNGHVTVPVGKAFLLRNSWLYE